MEMEIIHNPIQRRVRAFTIVEAIVAMVVLASIMIGAWRFRYHAAMDAENAARRADAVQLANNLVQSWTAVDGRLTFNPALCAFDDVLSISTADVPQPFNFLTQAIQPEQGFLISSAYAAGASAAGTSGQMAMQQTPAALGRWQVQMDLETYFASLYYRDEPTIARLRSLWVIVEWTDAKNSTQSVRLSSLVGGAL